MTLTLQCARSGLQGDRVWQSLDTLSGGEQTKVQLYKLVLQHGNWLLLDEPTNHLDITAKKSLREALAKFDGTVLLLSHEHEFFHGWVTDVWDMLHWLKRN